MKRPLLKSIFVFTFILAIISSLTISLLSRSSGYTGATNNGCTCHGVSNSSTSLAIESNSGDFVMAPGETETFTITLSNSSGKVQAGINIAVKDNSSGGDDVGSLTAGNGLKKEQDELTHSSPRNLSNGEVEFEFEWQAPSTPGTYYIKAVGNATDDNGGTSNDHWNSMAIKEVIVKGIELSSLNGGDEICAGGSTSISWDADGVTNVRIELSTNSGNTWDVLIENSTPASSGQYSWDVPSNLSGLDYRIRLSDADDDGISDFSDSDFTIGGPPMITTQPQNTEACSGEDVTISIVADGIGLQYQWLKDGNVLPGETSSSLQLDDVNLDDAGSYTCQVSGLCGSPIPSMEGSLVILSSPEITEQSGNRTACIGSTITLSITATGADLNYAWYKNGNLIVGETNSTLELTDLVPLDAGMYRCDVISASCGTEGSQLMEVVVNNNPQITTQPTEVTVCSGNEFTLRVQADGEELTYQWFKDEVGITGATLSSYKVLDPTTDDSGLYKVVVTNPCGNIESEQVDVLINDAPNITLQPQTQTVLEGATVNFTVNARSASEITYQWRKNDEDLTGQNTETLTLMNVSELDAGDYYCLLTNDCGESITEAATLTIQASGSGPILTLSQDSFDFGNVNLGSQQAETLSNVITNTGDGQLEITNISINNTNSENGEFTIDIPGISTLNANESLDLNIYFTPVTEGLRNSEIIVETNVGNDTLKLTGNAIEADDLLINISVNSIDFGEIQSGSSKIESFDINNPSNSEVSLLSAEITGNSFSTNLTSFPVPIPANNSLSLDVTFNAALEGSYEDNLILRFDNDQEITIPLSGTVGATSIVGSIASSLELFPNPSSSEVNIKIISLLNTSVDISIIDQQGKMINQLSKIQITEGENIIKWNLNSNLNSKINSGYYTILVSQGDNQEALKLIVE